MITGSPVPAVTQAKGRFPAASSRAAASDAGLPAPRVRLVDPVATAVEWSGRADPGAAGSSRGALIPAAAGGWMAMEEELKRAAKEVVDRIVHLRDSL
jgi:hypothetical protein